MSQTPLSVTDDALTPRRPTQVPDALDSVAPKG
jgi:hypothetical protein